MRVIIGMVIEPVITTLLLALPERVPNRLLATTATLAGPPRQRPIRAMLRSVKKSAPPVAKSTRPNRMKAKTMPNTTAAIRPSMLLVSR